MLKLKQDNWDLERILPQSHTIPQVHFDRAPVGIVDNFCKLLSRDVFSEGDSQPFYDYLQTRKAEFSEKFLSFLDLWLADELKHYEALRRVYHCLSGVSFTEMDNLFSDRVHEIEPIKLVLEDEFTILLTFMFDELGSVYSYRRDLREYYCHFGLEIKKIGHHLVKDEGTHFNNAAELILNLHHHRLGEVKDFLEQVSKLEKSLKTYHKSFFLDHAQEQCRFPQNFNQMIIQVILARLGLAKKPTSEELKPLWQWTPQGHSFVPVYNVSSEFVVRSS